jgi:hypothetical protein
MKMGKVMAMTTEQMMASFTVLKPSAAAGGRNDGLPIYREGKDGDKGGGGDG